MGFFDKLYARVFGKAKRQSVLTPPWVAALSGSGVTVTKETAMNFTAVWCAIRILSESVAQLPLQLCSVDINGDKTIERGHNLYQLLHTKPNANMTKYSLIQKVMLDLCTNGNSYIKIERSGASVVALKPIKAEAIKIIENNGEIFYQNQQTGDTYDGTDVLHFKGLSSDGIVGLSPITICANSIGWGLALEEYGNTFFKNGAKLSGILQSDRAMSEEAINRLRNSFQNNYGSLGQSNQTLVLEEGLKFASVSISNEQAQFLASRIFSISEIARIFNVPPHLLKDLSKSSFNNIEQQGAEFVIYSLMPYIVNIEEEINSKLFKPSEIGKYFVEFNVGGLMRGSVKDRSDYYKTMLNIGAMTINEIRQKENLNSIPNGNENFMQVNMATVDQIVGGTPSEEPAPAKVDEEISEQIDLEPQSNGNE